MMLNLFKLHFFCLSISNIASIHKLNIETYYNIIRYNVINLINLILQSKNTIKLGRLKITAFYVANLKYIISFVK